ncbi:hypothetical protein MycrhN_6108 [Mycolicibacterium rhodesiae NBB3]|uniref:Diacylglycerol O-acyltransferase n=1 Tax=Mycolicibacterium rhodesiae (strain NBB3) TaxID=710685 RepID=G8RSN6_MYCRN|nr:hypothetical protein [Mycolicibacterium rhodesiae]AEV76569.1 hypothetical protein MycrhN_6108 [Mycolicibacterium rhodesiae NBB3]
MSNVLDLVDQSFFRLGQASGVGQCVWVYNRAVDIDGLRRFHEHLQRGRLARRIERSPLPFGRHRWVTPSDRSELEIVAIPRPREELDAWLIEQAATPLDPEHGPGWHLATMPFTDGGAAVSLVLTHCLTDGIGGCVAIVEAACGYDIAIEWPAAGSRRKWHAIRQDARQTMRDMPAIGRAAIAAARFARRNRGSAPAPVPPAPITGGDELVTLPTATIFLDADEWDARADALGGTGNTLLAGLSARIAERLGRVAVDGTVNVAMPVNERTADDTRANAVAMVDVMVDPAPAANDLREIRTSTKEALIRHREVPDERQDLLPLVPLLPERVTKRMASVATGGTTNVVVSSNLGEAPAPVNQPDGTDADYVALLSRYPAVSKTMIDQLGGVLVVHSGRVHDQVFVSVLGYQPDRPNSNDTLRSNLVSALGDFSLAPVTGWECADAVDALPAV